MPKTKLVSWGEESVESFTKRKLNMQEVSRKQFSMQQVPQANLIRNKVHEQIRYASSSMIYFSFIWRKINVQVSWREKSTCNKVQE